MIDPQGPDIILTEQGELLLEIRKLLRTLRETQARLRLMEQEYRERYGEPPKRISPNDE